MYITMGTAVYGYISYEFLGLFEAVQCVPCNLAATPYNWRNHGPHHPRTVRELWSESPPGRGGHEGPHHELDPFLTCSRGGSILKWVTLEFRLIMHEMNRVTDSE